MTFKYISSNIGSNIQKINIIFKMCIINKRNSGLPYYYCAHVANSIANVSSTYLVCVTFKVIRLLLYFLFGVRVRLLLDWTILSP